MKSTHREQFVTLWTGSLDTSKAAGKKSAVTSKKDTGDYPDIVKFLEFVGAVADEVNDPIYGYRHHEDRNKKSSKPAASVTKHPFTRSFNTSVSSGSSPSQSATNNQKHSSGFNHVCPLCAEGHRLFGCQAFKAKKPLERLNLTLTFNVKLAYKLGKYLF